MFRNVVIAGLALLATTCNPIPPIATYNTRIGGIPVSTATVREPQRLSH